jgi:hypothetical protein
MQGEGQKEKQDQSYSARSLGCALGRYCPPGRIEEGRHCIVVEAAAWPDDAIHSGTPDAFSE